MKIFLDANVLVSVLNKEYPLFTYSSRIISLHNHRNYQVYTSPICLAIAFYFSEKKYKTQIAKQKIKLLADNINIADATSGSVIKVINNIQVNDFEDGLEYYAALESNCQCIVTEDVDDFYFSSIEVLNCTNFFEKYLIKKA